MIQRNLAAGVLALLYALSAVSANGGQDTGEKILFRSATSLPPEYRDVFDRMLDYDRFMYPNLSTSIEYAFSVAMIDLDGREPLELAIALHHEYLGIAPRMAIVLARRTPRGWRFVGRLSAPIDETPRSKPNPTGRDRDQPTLYRQAATHEGWRVLNTGPVWDWRYASGEVRKMGGYRICWTNVNPSTTAEPSVHASYGLPYDSGGPGYFDWAEFDEDCR